MTYEQIQKYAEAVGWSLTDGAPSFIARYRLSGDFGVITNETLTPIKARLAAKYREFAAQAQQTFKLTERALGGHAGQFGISWANYQLTRIADSLSEPEEPTMLERLMEIRQEPKSRFEGVIVDALIELYKAKEMSK